MIIGFETADGKPVRLTKKQKENFLAMSNMKEKDVIFADNTPSSVVIGASLITNGNKKK
jgi:hypothetical protein